MVIERHFVQARHFPLELDAEHSSSGLIRFNDRRTAHTAATTHKNFSSDFRIAWGRIFCVGGSLPYRPCVTKRGPSSNPSAWASRFTLTASKYSDNLSGRRAPFSICL